MNEHQGHLHEASHCHDCGAAVQYHYCSVCGQETRLHVASAREFMHEFIGHYIALEGKLWQTIRLLMFYPGRLTADYIAGRRKRYVEPLRVYLTMSLLFFAVLKLFGPPVANMEDDPPKAASTAARVERQAAPAAKPSKPAEQINRGMPMPPQLEKKVDAFFDKPAAEQNLALRSAFFSYVPYAMFLLMPLFALFLKVLYLGTGRYYGEHMLFALHANAFAFAMFSILIGVSAADIGLLTFACVLWLFAYLPIAMQRVYGGPRWATFLRWQAVSVLHAATIAAAILGAFALAVAV